MPRIREGIVWKAYEETTIIFDVNGLKVHSLEDVGTDVWKLIDGERTAEEIAALIAKEYEAAPAMVLDDVNELLATLATKGVVHL